MRVLVTAVALVASVVASRAESPERAINIGPWQIEASFTANDKFDRCVMSRTTEEGIETRISRDKDGLALSMSSPRWKLDKGNTRLNLLRSSSLVWKAGAMATAQSVRVALTDQQFNNSLKSADILEVRGAGSTIRVLLDKSAAALSRLESCYKTNIAAVETNPFVAPSP